MQTFETDEKQLVKLCFYQPEYGKALQEFNLSEEQKEFTALPSDALKQCLKDSNRRPVVIVVESTVVGFFVLHYGKNISSFTKNPNAILLRALSIDSICQGKGYAKRAMLQVPEFVSKHFNWINEIVLAVNEGNLAAKELYEKTGYVDKGIRREGRVGMQYILHCKLS
jgi:RimJ/RimL family protein N-acetyltransferase